MSEIFSAAAQRNDRSFTRTAARIKRQIHGSPETIKHRHGFQGSNDGWFIQMAFDLDSNDARHDVSRWSGIEMDVVGNNEVYELRLRTDQLSKPWESYRMEFSADVSWHTVRMPFSEFSPLRHDLPYNPAQLRRIGVLAIGRELQADIAVSTLWFFR